jgi:pyruvate/2-oxoglutarate dehydrogenase complex dihydrolipoamide dehydrogenase (E3) component
VSQRIVILGGGPAGYEAALVAAELGAHVTVVADEGLGGNSVLWDSVPSKALIVAAEAMGWVHIADELGVHLPAARSIVPSSTSRRSRPTSSSSAPTSPPTSSARSPRPG